MIGGSAVLAKLVPFALSLIIAYLAYHGYRRSGREPMRYVSVGFVFIGFGAICEGLIYTAFNTSLMSASLIQAVIVSSGMILILVSLTK
jgi:hypothetical protein